MKKHTLTLAALIAAGSYTAMADNATTLTTPTTTDSLQNVAPKNEGGIKYEKIDLDTENGVVSLAGSKGFVIQSRKGDFVFKPYMLVQTSANFNWYDDEGLDKAYNQDNVENSGFAIPNAILGFTGKAFNKVSFNLSINAAKSGGNLLQQAWFDVKFKEPLQLRVGKFKTPFSHAYLTTLGETLFPQPPPRSPLPQSCPTCSMPSRHPCLQASIWA